MVVFFAAVTFAVTSLIVLSAFYMVTAETPTERRMRLLREVGEENQKAKPGAKQGIIHRLFAAIGQYGLSRRDQSLSQMLSAAGMRGPNVALVFLGARTLLSFGPALVLLVAQVSGGKPVPSAIWLAIAAWAVGHVAVNSWLRQRSARRIQQINETLPDSLDLMVVCLESGLGLNATIARVGEERAALHDPLGDEFAQVAFELRSGRTREDSLRALGSRNGVEDLKALVALIIQSDKLGASMAKTLRAHADLLRTKRRQRAEEAARKLPIKVLFPLAAFLLPPLFIMVVGPAILQFRDLVKMITQG